MERTQPRRMRAVPLLTDAVGAVVGKGGIPDRWART
jgi:hypothetical protein